MSFMAAGALVVGAYGAYSQDQASKNATKASTKGNNAAIAEQQRQFDTIMSMLQPQRDLGNNAINSLNRLYGYAPTQQAQVGGSAFDPNAPKPPPGYKAPNEPGGLHGLARATSSIGDVLGLDPFGSGSRAKKAKKKAEAANALYETQLADYNAKKNAAFQASEAAKPQGLASFEASPDYQFRRDEGGRDIQNSFAAQGGAQSGNALRRLSEFNSNLASGEFAGYFNRLASMAGIGQTANAQGVYAAQNTGNNVSNALANNGNARASGIVNSSNAWSDFANSLGQFGGQWAARKKPNEVTGGWV